MLVFPASAPFDAIERPISGTLVLRVRRDRFSDGGIAGWTVEVRDKRRPATNLLYHSRLFHGPHPSLMDAWHLQTRFLPADRHLPVYGYPWEIRLTCSRCTTSGTGDRAKIVGGTLKVRWHRLRKANPRQEPS